MASELNVVAPYTQEWNDYLSEEARLVRNAPSNWEVILGYDNRADLVDKIRTLQSIDPDHPCLKTLEIDAHANPISINDLSRTDVASWGTALKTLVWCDEASVYLSGCNTGLTRNSASTNPAVIGPIAKLLADALAYDPATFAHKIIVYGSNGYLSGTHMEGSEETVDSFTEYNFAWAIPPVTKTFWPKFPGGSNASGNAVWIPFKNGNW